jgi:heparanase 1
MTLTRNCFHLFGILWAAASSVALLASPAQAQSSVGLNPSQMSKLATVDPRFASYNVEMVEVTGGRFWKPYKSATQPETAAKANPAAEANQQVGVSNSLYQYRPPIDLSNPRLWKLATALGPVYMRVSGSWANSTYFQDDDLPALKEPPKGFRGVLTRAEWKGVVDFSRAVDAKIVTSVAISPGTRDANGVWTPDQAKAFFDYTKKLGGSIAATEFMNEPTFPGPGGAPSGYNPAAFAKDIKAFEPFLRKESPQTVFLGPGGVMEGISMMPGGAPGGMQIKLLNSEDLMKETGPAYDAFSYHFYGTISHRCMGNLKLEQALTADWLDRTDTVEAFYAAIRDKYLPGKTMWLNETAEAACGGDQLAGQFVDTFRYLNQLGTLAQKGVQTVMHNTLASSDYGLLNEDTYEPRPDYWAALLWNRTMGTVVLDPKTPKDQVLRVYAQCSKNGKGGVTILALNTDTAHERAITLPKPAERLTLTAPDLTSNQVMLNGKELKPEADGSVGPLKGAHVDAGVIQLGPSSVTFLTIPSAHNQSCK